jgi:hypothetical protein
MIEEQSKTILMFVQVYLPAPGGKANALYLLSASKDAEPQILLAPNDFFIYLINSLMLAGWLVYTLCVHIRVYTCIRTCMHVCMYAFRKDPHVYRNPSQGTL